MLQSLSDPQEIKNEICEVIRHLLGCKPNAELLNQRLLKEPKLKWLCRIVAIVEQKMFREGAE